jgi:hypothetical protein
MARRVASAGALAQGTTGTRRTKQEIDLDEVIRAREVGGAASELQKGGWRWRSAARARDGTRGRGAAALTGDAGQAQSNTSGLITFSRIGLPSSALRILRAV